MRTEPGGGERAPAIVCDNLVKIYKTADLEAVALQGLDLVIERGEFVAMVGASGSGKSTLLNILGGLDVPSAGQASVAEHDLLALGAKERVWYRREVVGFVWQQTARNLVPYLSAMENVELPMVLGGRSDAERRRRASMLLDQVGLGDRIDHRPSELSGGQQQRVAIAVAIANEPAVVLADEPTGELDTTTAGEIVELLQYVNAEHGTTILVVTHDPVVAERVRRTVAIRDGRTSSEILRRGSPGHPDRIGDGEEFAVLDRAGRLQLPAEHLRALGLAERVRLRLGPDHIQVWPDDGRPIGDSTGTRSGDE